jgi:hypothetical protein
MMEEPKRKAKHRFCTPMKKHYMTNAAANSAIALSMAKELQTAIGHKPGIQELVQIINKAAIDLIKLCESAAYAEGEDIAKLEAQNG